MSPADLSRWRDARSQFIEAGGHTTQSFGLGRIIGQIFALLYLSPKPLCLDEMVEELGVSKASVSTAVRQLERWSAVKQVWVKGDRRDFYEAETDFNAIIREGFLAMLRKKFDTAGRHMESIEAALKEATRRGDSAMKKEIEIVAHRVQKAKEFHGKVNSLLTNPILDHLL